MLRTYKLHNDRFSTVYRGSAPCFMHFGWTGRGKYEATYTIREPFMRAVCSLEVACGIRSEEEAAHLVGSHTSGV